MSDKTGSDRSECDIETLVCTLRIKKQDLVELYNRIYSTKASIKETEQQLYILCDHEWVREPSTGPRDNGEFYFTCKKCGLSY